MKNDVKKIYYITNRYMLYCVDRNVSNVVFFFLSIYSNVLFDTPFLIYLL